MPTIGLAQLTAEVRARGVTAYLSGNHAQASAPAVKLSLPIRAHL